MPDLRSLAADRFNTFRNIVTSRSWAQAWIWRKLGAPEACFHTAGNTAANRYPAVFCEVRHRVAQRQSCRVLSFGCSTGAEVFTLRDYLPRAEITGIDINPSSIAQAKRALAKAGGDPGITFRVAATCAEEPAASLDAIMAMTVFCSGRLRIERPESCAGILSFAAFEAEIARFAERLKPGGILVVGNANFRVDDTLSAEAFTVIERFDESALPGLPRPIYDSGERLIPNLSDPGAIYRRTG